MFFRFDLHSEAWMQKFQQRKAKEDEKKRAAEAREVRAQQPKVRSKIPQKIEPIFR